MIKLDGRTMADWYLRDVEKEIDMRDVTPVLAVVLVGDNPAGKVYVRQKEKACERCGIRCLVKRLPESATEYDVRRMIKQLNGDEGVDGIIVQLPLPAHISAEVIDMITPIKDVDGLSAGSKGLLGSRYGYEPCTPKGIIRLLNDYGIQMVGADVVIIGRSDLVGRPLARMMEMQNATVTLCHSWTRDLKLKTRRADIVVCAVGKPDFLTADMIKSEAVVIDVGINRVGGKLVGDCAADVADKAGALTPVPGGVGPMTVAMLMENTLEANKRR